ncbi:MAG: mannosyl-3-phosphoglycerate phosphatase [Alteromonadaceae bacterium]|nr:mannosyl-3-phosphoglycerate phosphatase [Alteromonadaceae bacterium]|tara:strand:- start:239 stop:1087 length:849 start_codon:yes stop_codon:yes gene_type:complete
MSKKMVIFTDLDGTLLDHHSYSWAPARPALEALNRGRIPVILCSSKTRAEIATLRDELQNQHPYIVENGAAVIIPRGYFEPAPVTGQLGAEPDHTVSFGTSRDRILAVLDYLKRQGFRFRSFAAMSAGELAQVTGLSEAAAVRAQTRTATEPLLWEADADSLEVFKAVLARYRLQLLEGGRFFHVMGFFDKADAMEYLLERYRIFYQNQDVVSVALGDSPNDTRMLEHADIPVVIANAVGGSLQLPNRGNAVYSDKKGPEGWNASILQILKESFPQAAQSTE